MASAALAGRRGKLALTGTSTGTASQIAEVRNWEINPTQDLIDVTSFDSGGDAEFIAGRQSWTLNFGALFVSTEADQNIVREMFSSGGVKKWFSVYPSTTKATRWQGYAFVQNYRVGAADDNSPVLFDVSLQGTGAFVYTSG